MLFHLFRHKNGELRTGTSRSLIVKSVIFCAMAFMIFLSDNTVARVFNIFLGLKVVASDRVICHKQ